MDNTLLPSSQRERCTRELIQWAVQTFSPHLTMTSGFGLNGAALVRLLWECSQETASKVPIVFIDTGYHFAETLQTGHRVQRAYDLDVRVYRPDPERTLASVHNLYSYDANLCCALRKVEPLQRAIQELGPQALLNTRARHQARSRAAIPVVEWDRYPIQINSLYDWTRAEIADHLRRHQAPYNALTDRGCPSVGCWPCTRSLAVGEGLRAGQWAGQAKLECGLWTAP